MLKKIAILIIVCLFAMTALSGCAYWEGYSKSQCVQLVEEALEEKYGEEFVVDDIHVGTGGWYGVSGPLVATCYSKSNDSLLFEAEYNKFGDAGEINDLYIQSIVREEMINSIDSVLSKHYANYAIEISVDNADSGIIDAKTASIKTFTEAVPDNKTSIWIAFDANEVESYSEIEPLLVEATGNYHYSYAIIHCYYVSSDTVKECNEVIEEDIDPFDIIGMLSEGRCIENGTRMDNYIYKNNKIKCTYYRVGTELVNLE